ncbi:EAL domain-containing protein [Uliginosibacterium sp. H1]|uniref:EAL domain-containing protein n=1 Tax=Uliginosibacterium sp. H1 TaxID=3114757 RepID=UPI002E19CEC8|nr:EAL domain-containing protein [Uliginosibacterium sp. H1]
MPQHHSLRQRWLIAVCIVTALMPLVVCAVLGVWRGIHSAEVDNRRRAEQLLQGTGRILDHTVQRLQELRWTAASACEDDVIEKLTYGVYNSIYIREMGVFDPDLALLCTNFGRLYIKVYQDIKHRLPESGLFYNVIQTVVMKERSVIVNLRFPEGGGVNALIDPMVFEELARTAGVARVRSLQLGFVPGDSILERDQPALPDSLFKLHTTAALDKHPVRIELHGSDEEVWEAIEDQLPRYLLAGVALSLLAAWCLRQVWNRLQAPEEALRQALARREFLPYYQPIINLETGLCDGAEVLMRWRHPGMGLIPPDSFIPIAERTGLIKPMTALLLERVCAQLGPLLRNRNLYVSINLSRSHLDDLDIVDSLLTYCRRYEVPPATFVFEITERGLPDDPGHAEVVVDALRGLGCRVFIDDFGTGHNGLALLQRLTVDALKIDRSFVEPIGDESAKARVIDSIIELADRQGLALVAEGVETEQQQRYLADHKVAHAQGYLFAAPMEAADLVLFLERTQPWMRAVTRD